MTGITRDPLGATDIEGALARRIAALRARLSTIGGQKERVEAGLATAAAQRRELGETQVRPTAMPSLEQASVCTCCCVKDERRGYGNNQDRQGSPRLSPECLLER